MFCIKCGKELPNDCIFCSRCGNRVVTNYITAQPVKVALTWKPLKGIFLNVVSSVVTITGIIISLFFSYMYIETKLPIFNHKKDSLSTGLFSIHQFTETIKDIFGNSASDFIMLLKIMFVVCIVDIAFAVIMLLIRLTRFKGNLYNSSLSYVPIAAPVLSLICIIIFNNDKTFEMFTAVYPISMILSLVLFAANIVICEIGLNFNWEMRTKEKKEKLYSETNIDCIHKTEETKEGKWDCVRCGWENKVGDKYCRNCGKKP